MAKATIADVARVANVSRKTVSRVLNGESGVKADTQAKVLNVIEQLGYAPNLSARRLRTRQSYQIGLVFVDFPENFYSNMMISGAVDGCDELGYDLLIRPIKVESIHSSAAIQRLLDRSNPDGLIVVPPLCEDEAALAPIVESGTPLVKVAALNSGKFCNIHCDEVSAAREAVEHLISLGHRRIGIINCLRGHAAGEWRRKGYLQALSVAGIEMETALVEHHQYNANVIEQSSRRLLSLPERPTAIFAASDTTAAVLYRVASQMSIRIPYDLSIVGFDDEPLSKNLWPPLTTVKQPVQELGKAAVELLVKRLIRNASNEKPVPLECKLIIRNSTGPVM